MRILFLVERPTQFETPFYRYAARDGAHRLEVVFTGERMDEPVFDPELGRSVSWGIDLLGGYPWAACPPKGRARWLGREIARERCDLVVTNGYTRPVYLLAAALARRAGVPTALRLDSVLFDAGPARRRAKRLLFARLLLPAYDLFLGVGSLTLDYLRACGVPAARTALFPYAIDVDCFRAGARLAPAGRAAAREQLGVPSGARVVLAVSKLNPREAPWDLVRAAANFEGEPPVHLLLAGDGPSRPELERLAAELAPGRIHFLGYVPYGELAALYAAADLFVHAVQEERWGVSVAEALACGLPVVASSRVGAAHDLVAAGRNGFTYAAGNSEELARQIEQALALPPAAVREENERILAGWDYAATWRGLVDAAARVRPNAGDAGDAGATGAGGR